jgi:hypothetical protein
MRPRLRQRHRLTAMWMIRLKLEPLDEGGYMATSPDPQGLVAEGAPRRWRSSAALARKIVESCVAHGDPLPLPKRCKARSVDAVASVTVVACPIVSCAQAARRGIRIRSLRRRQPRNLVQPRDSAANAITAVSSSDKPDVLAHNQPRGRRRSPLRRARAAYVQAAARRADAESV